MIATDGHTGIDHKVVKKSSTSKFQLALSYLKVRDTGGIYVVHMLPTVMDIVGAFKTPEFLGTLGFQKYRQRCKCFDEPCWWRYLWRVQSDGWDSGVTRSAVRDFDSFTESIDEMQECARQFVRLVGRHVDLFPWAQRFNVEPNVRDFSTQTPSWLNQCRVEEYNGLLHTLDELHERRRHFSTVEYCLWGTADELVDSVHYILTLLGLNPEKTQRGATVDLVLQYAPKTLQVGIEVTGTRDNIKKNSNKLTQAMAFLQQATGPSKAVILANTYRDLPISQREELEGFTADAARFMAPPGIVGLTTADLYRIWQDVTYHDADSGSVIGAILDHPGGVYTYTH
jgi:hypothetical protein